MSTLRFDPEFLAIVAPLLANRPTPQPSPNPEALAASMNAQMSMIIGKDIPEDIVVTNFSAPSPEGHSVPLIRIATAAQTSGTSQPAVLTFFAGGMVAGSAPMFVPHFARIVKATDVQIWAVDYRLAPTHKAPAQLNDAWTAIQWLSTNGPTHGVDPARLALYGESAGGGVACAAAIYAKDQKLNPPLKQLVAVYPMLDDRTTEKYKGDWPIAAFSGILRPDNAMFWDAYLSEGKRARDGVSVYHAPGRAVAKDLEGMPRTYLDVGGLDLYRDEVLRFGRELAEANVEVQLHLWAGVGHGFDMIAPQSWNGKTAWEARYRCIREL